MFKRRNPGYSQSYKVWFFLSMKVPSSQQFLNNIEICILIDLTHVPYLYDCGVVIFLVDEIYTCQYKITNSTAILPNMHKYYCANPYSVSRKAVKNYTSHCYTFGSFKCSFSTAVSTAV